MCSEETTIQPAPSRRLYHLEEELGYLLLRRHRLQSPPPERIIYYLLGHREDDGAAELFLKTLRRHLEKEEALQLL